MNYHIRESIKQQVAKTLKEFYGIVKSLKFAALIIFLLILMYFLGLIIPQKWMFDTRAEYLAWVGSGTLNRFFDLSGFTDIYLSPVTLVLLVYFFVSLLLVSVGRVPVILKRAFLRGETPPVPLSEMKGGRDVRIITSAKGGAETGETVKTFFRKRRWSLIRAGDESYHVVKNRYSPLGFLLFHLSFFICLISALLLSYTRFSGKLALTEGQYFENDIRQFHAISKKPRIMQELPSLGLLLDKVYPSYEEGVPTELTVELKVNYRGVVKNEVVGVNRPIRRGALSIIPESIGVSPLFVARDLSGREIDGAYVSLKVLNGQEDSFRFGWDKKHTFHVLFFPDYTVEGGVEKTKSLELRKPALKLAALREGFPVYEGTLMTGEKADLGLYTISFEDVRYWVDLIIVREYGKTPLIMGFALALVGLVMRLVFYQKRLRIAVEEADGRSVLYIGGRSDYLQHSFREEMARLLNDLDVALKQDLTDV